MRTTEDVLTSSVASHMQQERLPKSLTRQCFSHLRGEYLRVTLLAALRGSSDSMLVNVGSVEPDCKPALSVYGGTDIFGESGGWDSSRHARATR